MIFDTNLSQVRVAGEAAQRSRHQLTKRPPCQQRDRLDARDLFSAERFVVQELAQRHGYLHGVSLELLVDKYRVIDENAADHHAAFQLDRAHRLPGRVEEVQRAQAMRSGQLLDDQKQQRQLAEVREGQHLTLL